MNDTIHPTKTEGTHGFSPQSQRQAAADAGISEHQQLQAVRVANDTFVQRFSRAQAKRLLGGGVPTMLIGFSRAQAKRRKSAATDTFAQQSQPQQLTDVIAPVPRSLVAASDMLIRPSSTAFIISEGASACTLRAVATLRSDTLSIAAAAALVTDA